MGDAPNERTTAVDSAFVAQWIADNGFDMGRSHYWGTIHNIDYYTPGSAPEIREGDRIKDVFELSMRPLATTEAIDVSAAMPYITAGMTAAVEASTQQNVFGDARLYNVTLAPESGSRTPEPMVVMVSGSGTNTSVQKVSSGPSYYAGF